MATMVYENFWTLIISLSHPFVLMETNPLYCYFYTRFLVKTSFLLRFSVYHLWALPSLLRGFSYIYII
jgi:hypothetical protein